MTHCAAKHSNESELPPGSQPTGHLTQCLLVERRGGPLLERLEAPDLRPRWGVANKRPNVVLILLLAGDEDVLKLLSASLGAPPGSVCEECANLRLPPAARRAAW